MRRPNIWARDKRNLGTWERPQSGYLKFNVNGSARGQLGSAGIGGVLRDDCRNIKLFFSKHIGEANLNKVELLAIKEAFLFFCALDNYNNKGLITISSNVVHWSNNPESCPWILRRIIMQIESLKARLTSWNVLHINREQNDLADGLAKAGVERDNNLVVMY
ncbi:hypothetical protein COLO4_20696 [Corchorus olitorius]|uniref:RNase H type-1 domain-containing protein n=1 Tax=Corchorus olitorius TaxID=93759 RepID=A0A1R3IXK0_9ROSI|nr:hypothetical protein COLO4_20696 [Corchorus olitorius]